VQLAADKNARDGELLRLATFAVGTAHEIGTPLSTMLVVVGDLRRSDTPPPDWKESVELLWRQIQACKRSLSGLAGAADSPGVGRSHDILAGVLVHSLMERIHLLRPEVSVQLRSMRADPDLLVNADLTLTQALLNLIDNAVDVSPHQVELRTAQHDAKFVIEILDRGPGISPAVRERLGEAFVTGKEPGQGCGIGVFLARNAIERLGGTVTMLDRADGGTRVQVVLPAFRKGGPGEHRASGHE
jgi:two-component system sensor histidine kinase RegB